MFETQRNRKGELVLEINFPSLSFGNLKRFASRLYLVLIAGLGLGIGLGIMIAFMPTPIKANLNSSLNRGLEIERIKSPQLGINTPVKSGQAQFLPLISLEAPAIHLESSGGIGRGKTAVIQGVNQDNSLNNLSQAKLGDEIFILGSNQGWYRYRIVSTKQVDLDKLAETFIQRRESVILFTINHWQQIAQVVIAVPLK